MARPAGNPLTHNATQHLGRAPGGGSGAQLYKVAEDDCIYVVKLKGSAQGIRILFNEYVSGRIGEIIGVPFGPHAIVVVPEALLPAAGEPNINARMPGAQFGTEYFEHGQADLLQLRQAGNFPEFASVVVFDTFIARGNGRQYLVYPSSGTPDGARDTGAIFDQGFSFTGTPNWTVAALNADHNCVANNGLGLKNHLRSITAYDPYIGRVESLTAGDLEAIVREAPLAEWQVSEEEVQAVAAWLERRKGLVRSAIRDYLR